MCVANMDWKGLLTLRATLRCVGLHVRCKLRAFGLVSAPKPRKARKTPRAQKNINMRSSKKPGWAELLGLVGFVLQLGAQRFRAGA